MTKKIFALLALLFISNAAQAYDAGFESWRARENQAVEASVAGDRAFFFSVVEARLGIPASALQQNAHCDQTQWGCNDYYFVTNVGNIECGHRRSPYGLDPEPTRYYCTEGTYYDLHPKLFWISEAAVQNRNLKMQTPRKAPSAKTRKSNGVQKTAKSHRQSASGWSGLGAPAAPAAPAAPSAF